jgi:hypothetical protein
LGIHAFCRVLSGASKDPQSEGLLATCEVLSFTRTNALQEAITVNVTIKRPFYLAVVNTNTFDSAVSDPNTATIFVQYRVFARRFDILVLS